MYTEDIREFIQRQSTGARQPLSIAYLYTGCAEPSRVYCPLSLDRAFRASGVIPWALRLWASEQSQPLPGRRAREHRFQPAHIRYLIRAGEDAFG